MSDKGYLINQWRKKPDNLRSTMEKTSSTDEEKSTPYQNYINKGET